MIALIILAAIFGAYCGMKFQQAYIRGYVRQFGLEQFRRVYVDRETTDNGA